MRQQRMAKRGVIMKAIGHELGRSHIRCREHKKGHGKPGRPTGPARTRRWKYRHRLEARRLAGRRWVLEAGKAGIIRPAWYEPSLK